MSLKKPMNHYSDYVLSRHNQNNDSCYSTERRKSINKLLNVSKKSTTIQLNTLFTDTMNERFNFSNIKTFLIDLFSIEDFKEKHRYILENTQRISSTFFNNIIIKKYNEGRKNIGIGFKDSYIFIKFIGVSYSSHDIDDSSAKRQLDNMIQEFALAYIISKLKTVYPYFIDTLTIVDVNKYSNITSQLRLSNINEPYEFNYGLVYERGDITLTDFIKQKLYNRIVKVFPGYNSMVEEIDKKYESFIERKYEGISTWKLYQSPEFKKFIRDEIDPIIQRNLYNLLVVVKKEINYFMYNINILFKHFTMIDLILFLYYGSHMRDKKFDNFMVKEIKIDDSTKNYTTYFFDELHGSDRIKSTFKILNRFIFDEQEDDHLRYFIYPVDFGAESIDREKLIHYIKNDINLNKIIETLYNKKIDPNIFRMFINNTRKYIHTDDISSYKTEDINDKGKNIERYKTSIILTGGPQAHIGYSIYSDFSHELNNIYMFTKFQTSDSFGINMYDSWINSYEINCGSVDLKKKPRGFDNIKDIIDFIMSVLDGKKPKYNTDYYDRSKGEWFNEKSITDSDYFRIDRIDKDKFDIEEPLMIIDVIKGEHKKLF